MQKILVIFISLTISLNTHAYLRNANVFNHAIKAVFTHIYKYKLWGEQETLSGTGSTLKQTEIIRKEIPELLHTLRIKTILDAPCGDCNWMSTLNLDNYTYIGIDIVPEIITLNKQKFTKQNIKFLQLNVIYDQLPKADIIICRDLFIHFPNGAIRETIKNFKKTGAKYLLTTTYPGYLPAYEVNQEIPFGQWKPVDLEKFPFKFPKPIRLIHEQATDNLGKNRTKSLALWDLTKITV